MKKILKYILIVIMSSVLGFGGNQALHSNKPTIQEKLITKIEFQTCTLKQFIEKENLIIKKDTLHITKTDTFIYNTLDTLGLLMKADTLIKEYLQEFEFFSFMQKVDIKPTKYFQGAKIHIRSAFSVIDENNVIGVKTIPKLNFINVIPYPPQIITIRLEYPKWKKISLFTAGMFTGYIGVRIYKNF